MALNIKNVEVHALAAELAHLRNTTVTQAVLDAVKHDLARERDRSRKAKLAGQLLEIGRRCAAHIAKPVASDDHGPMLYDRRGLPR
jgi:antitoxin VapB